MLTWLVHRTPCSLADACFACAAGSLARCTVLLTALAAEEGAPPLRFALHDAALHCGESGESEAANGEDALAAWCAAGGALILTGAALSEPGAPGAAATAAALGRIVADASGGGTVLLLATGAPQRTPQTLPDAYLRTMRNEPANLPCIAVDCAAAAGAPDAEALAAVMWQNALAFFGLSQAAEECEAAKEAPAVAAAAVPVPAAAAPAQQSSAQLARAAAAAAESDTDEDEEEAAPARVAGKQRARGGGSAFARLAVSDDNASASASSADASDASSDDDDAARVPTGQRRAALARGAADGTAPDGGAACADGDDGARYACRRCRARLFAPRASLAHGRGGALAPFARAAAAADDNRCIAAVFVPCTAAQLPSLGLAAASDAEGGELKLACARCGAKLGRFAAAAQPCACGALVPGPAAKLAAARIDFVDGGADAEGDAEGALRALRLRGELDAAAGGDAPGDAAAVAAAAARRKRDAKRGVKKESKGNFSEYRNKKT
jgi:hypothetical protein